MRVLAALKFAKRKERAWQILAFASIKRRRLFIPGVIPENKAAPENTEMGDDILYALRLLKPQDRALLYARIIGGYDYEELSQQMNKSPATLRKRYERAKKKLANHLGIIIEGIKKYD